ncbi:MAG: hypothetical protein WBW04_19265 [Nitrolancea sp.]
MRFLIKAVVPTEAANASIKAGTFVKNIQTALESIKPEAVYFTETGGDRTAYLIVDIPSASDIPSVGEPLYLALGGTVELMPVMLPEDLMKAQPAFEAAVRAFA